MKNTLARLLSYKTFYKLFAFEYLIPIMMLSFVAWYISYSNGLITIYNDAMSHLNISRLVIDNREPGLAQLGGVWLPMTHVMPLLLIWNDWAWQSGFAASFFSMVAYVLSVWAIYKSIFLITKKQAASIIGGLAFAFNLNMLYLQTTPMTEPMYIGIFCLSALVFTYYLTKTDNTKYLLLLGVLGFFQVLTRYDGWFVIGIIAMLIAAYEFFVAKRKFSEVFGKVFLFGTPVAFGIALWLLWNLLIFKDPLFFAFGPYSAHAQQAIYEARGALFTKGDVLSSTVTYTYAALHNIGIYIAAVALAGLAYFFITRKLAIAWSVKAIFLLFLASPIIFNILALYLGFSIIFTPPVTFNQSLPEGPWFNIRYGLLALPLVAVLVGLFASWRKLAWVIVIEVMILQAFMMYSSGIVTIIDGNKGISSFEAADISQGIKDRVKPDDSVLMSIYSFNPVIHRSGIQLDQIVHEGVSKQYPDALSHPERHVEWIVMANTPGDQVYKVLMIDKNKDFLKNFELVYTGNDASIYKNKHY